jgi:hypothetical protein
MDLQNLYVEAGVNFRIHKAEKRFGPFTPTTRPFAFQQTGGSRRSE